MGIEIHNDLAIYVIDGNEALFVCASTPGAVVPCVRLTMLSQSRVLW